MSRRTRFRIGTGVAVVSVLTCAIAWNELAAALMEDFSALPRRDRNLVRRAFLGPHPQGRRLYGVSSTESHSRMLSPEPQRAKAES